MTHHTAEHRSQAMNQCIEDCSQCERVCLETINYCLGEDHADSAHIALLAACADICGTGARTMLRSAAVHAAVCKACAEVCRECAASCEGFDDAEMEGCAEACRRCAKSCDAMAAR